MPTVLPNKNKIRIPFWAALPGGVFLSFILGVILLIAISVGALTLWKPVSSPPSKAVRIIDVDGYKIWVEANDGNIYSYEICYQGDTCNQWSIIDDQNEIEPFQCYPILRGEACNGLSRHFSPPPLLGKKIECVWVDSCFPDPSYRSETFFALMANGTIYYWHGGWGSFTFLAYFLLFFMIMPISVAIIISMVYLVIFLTDKFKRRANTGST
jgi:hypothetical protein